ncbi:Type 1 glutamine amidotransferase-like domain-containing protein [Allorhizobium taibaishanense]|nr:Type 1 glutamine amidotransferase-like domain-containing protein [Allorhizobium taibaishanense]
MSGGHTGGFLGRLKQSGLMSRLRTWAENGGVLIGTSAGAIILTPTIATDALFQGKPPENCMNETALDLVPFEFFPHLNADAAFLPALLRYSQHTLRPIIACNDGDGLAVTNGDIECIGQPLWVKNGNVRLACNMRLSSIEIYR